jgi:zinc protease
MNLREDKGYTYGAGSQFAGRRGAGPFVMSAQVKTDVTDESVSEMIKELRNLAETKPLTADELKESKDNIIKGYPQDFETSMSLAGQLNQIVLMDLPLDEWSAYVAKVSALDTATAARLVKEYLHPSDLLIVVVGDRAKIEADLRKLNAGEVTVSSLQELQL